jgi:hypothetical protein
LYNVVEVGDDDVRPAVFLDERDKVEKFEPGHDALHREALVAVELRNGGFAHGGDE